MNGNTFSIDTTLLSDYMTTANATAATVYPVVGGSDVLFRRVEDLVIEGNKAANPPLNGCRGGGIYFYRGFGPSSRAASCGTTTATASASSNPTT